MSVADIKIPLISIFLLLYIFGIATPSPCIHRDYGYGSTVCVCNATYCDDIDHDVSQLLTNEEQYLHYETNKEGKKLHLTVRNFDLRRLPWLILIFDFSLIIYEVQTMETYQTMLGFGGAMTDAAAMNIATLTNETQDNLLRQYFNKTGINYTFLRIPIAGTDFSTRYYTYCDAANDTDLSNFSLSEEDFLYKIPLTKRAIEMSERPLKLLTTSWAAPYWMTQPRRATPMTSKLQKKYYSLYADYFIKFLKAYKENGLDFWGLSPQNEPIDGILIRTIFNSLGWVPDEQAEFIGYHLGPALHDNGLKDLKIMILDDQRILLPFWANVMLNDENVNKYVSGIAIHWYSDGLKIAPASLIYDTWDTHRDKFLIYTEACVEREAGKPAVHLGSWEDAELVAFRMIEAFQNMVAGWVDWNIVLNPTGGPNWAKNFVDSPIIVNSTSDEFYKQPMFYVLAHFSKFVTPGSKRINIISGNSKGVLSLAFLREDNVIVVVFCNQNANEYSALITAGLRGNIKVILSPHSVHTIMYRKNWL